MRRNPLEPAAASDKVPGGKVEYCRLDNLSNAAAQELSGTFFGSGAVFLRKSPSRIETINDLDDDVANLFRCVREQLRELALAVAATPFSRVEYQAAFDFPPAAGPVERARRFAV